MRPDPVDSSLSQPACLFADGVDARGVEPGNTDHLAAAVGALAASPEPAARLGAAARRVAAERFDATGYGQQLLRVCRSVVTPRGARPPAAAGQ